MLTPSDKAAIAEYMGWVYHETDDKKWWNIIGKDGATHLLDLNDAALCVEKMVEKGDWDRFHDYTRDIWWDIPEYKNRIFFLHNYKFTAWLFNPDNFFTAMSAWLRSK